METKPAKPTKEEIEAAKKIKETEIKTGKIVTK